MSAPSLVVPLECEVLVANSGVVARDAFRLWLFDYEAFGHFLSPEPQGPLDVSTDNQGAGIYLHWTLPDALRAGVQDSTGAVSYPLVPNRWLIVRAQGSTTRQWQAWVLESDCPLTSNATQAVETCMSSYFVDPSILQLWQSSSDQLRSAFAPSSGSVISAMIGVPFALDGWSERDPHAMFLEAVAPANPLFSAYFAHHVGVFGFFDDLSGVDQDTLSYYVVGWYSDPARDIIAAGSTPYAALLTALGWTVAGGDDTTVPSCTLYSGGVFNIPWQRTGDPPAPDPLQAIRDGGTLNVAIGNTTIDAFSALVAQQVTDPGTLKLLRAFNYDMLGVLNDVNGPALLDARIRQQWFGSTPGGYRWTIVDRQSNGQSSATLTDAEAAWLAQLNQDQAALDAAIATLGTSQWTVNALWLKRGFLSDPSNVFPNPPPDAPAVSDITNALDPTQSGSSGQTAPSPAYTLIETIQAVQHKLALVPQPQAVSGGTLQDAFNAGVAAFAASNQLDPAKQLKAIPLSDYWRANNPVVVISGVDSPYHPDPDSTLIVRLSTSVVAAITVDGKPVSRHQTGATMPALPNASALPDGVAAIVDELFLLDPVNLASLASAAGVNTTDMQTAIAVGDSTSLSGAMLPASGIGTWSQPWEPLVLEWKGQFLPVGPQTGTEDNWTFDGTDYHYTGSATAEPQAVSGLSLLSPHVQFVFGSQLATFLSSHADDTTLADINTRIGSIFQWQFLAQELVGFNDALALRDVRAFRRPLPSDSLPNSTSSLSALLGFDTGPQAGPDTLPPPLAGRVATVPLISDLAVPFQGIRQGQFYFTDLLLYDRFGRTLTLISSTPGAGLFNFENFPVVTDASLQPATKLMPQVDAVMELPPRPVQESRLDVELVDRLDDTVLLSSSPDACPVCAWLVPNHLSGSLLIFAPDGSARGEVRLIVGIDGVTRTAQWTPPPNSPYAQVSDLQALSPHLADLLMSPPFVTESNFTAFLSAIDAGLWTIDPQGARADQNLTVLVGRPLALVRLRLGLSVNGDPIRDAGWAATLDTSSTPDWLTQPFAVRLGDQASRADGTIGYFAGLNYLTFNSVAAPETTGPQVYVQQIGPLDTGQNYLSLSFASGDVKFVTVLMDPRAAVSMTTGILPVTRVTLPQAFVDGPLANMEIGFRAGPLVMFVQPSPQQGDTPPAFASSVTSPRPAEQNGAWSWWEAGANGWTGYGVVDAIPNASIPPLACTLREGILQLTIDLESD